MSTRSGSGKPETTDLEAADLDRAAALAAAMFWAVPAVPLSSGRLSRRDSAGGARAGERGEGRRRMAARRRLAATAVVGGLLLTVIAAGLAMGITGAVLGGTAHAASGITSGGSITYVQDNDIWVTSPDGATRTRLTFDGGEPAPDGTGDTRYMTPSRSDAGDVVVAVRNQGQGSDTRGWIWVMDGQGQVITRFQHEQQPIYADGCRTVGGFDRLPRGLGTAEVSPDGTKVAYTALWDHWFWLSGWGCTSAVVVDVVVADVDGGNRVKVRSADPSLVPNLGWASWADNSRLMVGEWSGKDIWYADAPGWQAQRWVANVPDDAGREPALRASKLVSRNFRSGGASRLRLWSSNGGPPTPPTKRCDLSLQVGGGDGQFYSPSWAPDGNALVWYEGDSTPDEPGEGLQVMAVGDPATTTCPSGYVRQSLVEGGREPHWGPAPVPPPPVPTLAVDDVSLAEGDAGETVATFTISRSGPMGPESSVQWSTADGTATAPGDYVAGSGTVTFAAGDPNPATVSVIVNGDTLAEPDETFTLRLSNATGATIADDTGAATIINDDTRPGVSPTGDYDGDGKTDQAVYRPSQGVWFVKASAGTESAVAWGTNGDIPVPGDYDGDGRTDLAVYRPSQGVWFVKGSAGTESAVAWGTNGDIPVPGDYDGDGKTDLAVYRPSQGVWFVKGSAGTDPNEGGGVAWGTSGDIPVPLAPGVRLAFFPTT